MIGTAAVGSGMHRLVRDIGLKPAMGLLLTARTVSAEEAKARCPISRYPFCLAAMPNQPYGVLPELAMAGFQPTLISTRSANLLQS